MTKDEAFRIIDVDFDGIVNKKDIKAFVLKLPRIEVSEVTDPQIDRLFKLLDRFKRGYVQAEDFFQIFEYDSEEIESPKRSRNLSLSQTKSLDGLSAQIETVNPGLDWKVNARQQVGLVLSKKFEDLRTSFDSISLPVSSR